MKTRQAIDDKWKLKSLPPINDHQIILVGSNPLPCYVAALSLRPTKITFICSKETKVYAEKLKNRLVEKGFECDNADVIDDTCSTDEITKTIKRIEGVSTAGLHYTGGKKTMSVHAYMAWFAQNNDRRQASYIDAQKVALLFDDIGIEIPLTTDPCVSFDTLVDLHGITSAINNNKGYKTSPTYPDVAKKIRDIFEKCGIDRIRNMCRSLMAPSAGCDSSQNLETLENNRWDTTLYDELKFLLDRYYKESEKMYTFNQGEWLEEYTLETLNTIKTTVGLHDVIYDIKMKKTSICPDTNKEINSPFQSDVACMRGHTIFFFSCTTSSQRKVQKLKMFEAQVRAQQLGGDHARHALVCLSNAGDVAALKNEVKEGWDAPDYVEVFGWDAVMGDFAGALIKWINKWGLNQ